MFNGSAEIVQRAEVAPDHVELFLRAPELARAVPGQFAHVLTPGTLRRPISFSRLMPAEGMAALLFQVVGEGTAWLAKRNAGDFVGVLGPLGQGFPPPLADRPWCLVGGGVGIPPLYAALQRWGGAMRHPATVVLGARTGAYVLMEDDFRRLGAQIAVTTDDGSRGERGTVLGPLAHFLSAHPEGQVYACGPTPMLREVARLSQDRERVYLALEQRMGCGVGACLACVVLAQGEAGPIWRRVCHDGPVFPAEELIWS